MTQILIEESRYVELLKYEAKCKKQAAEPRRHVNDQILMEAIQEGINKAPVNGGVKTYDAIIKPIFVEIYGDRAGIRARQKAWKDGIARLVKKGVIKIEYSHAGMNIIEIVTVAP